MKIKFNPETGFQAAEKGRDSQRGEKLAEQRQRVKHKNSCLGGAVPDSKVGMDT